MTTLSERISWVLQHFHISQSELATLAGIKQPSVASWVSGKTKNMKSAPALAICSKLPLNQNWIVNGVGDPLVSNDQLPANQSNVEPIRGRMKRIPILSYVQAGDPTSTGQIAARQAAIESGDFIWVDMDLPDDCYALKVIGSSMEPDFREGDIIVIDPTIHPMPGDFVIATRGSKFSDDMETTFKKYRPRGYDEYGNEIFELIPLNEDYPIDNSRTEGLAVIGVMVEHRRSYRRRR